MEDWIKDQIKFGRTICLYDKYWKPIYLINPINYNKSLLHFIQDTFDPNSNHLIADNKNLRCGVPGFNFYTYFPNKNNPMEIFEVFSYFEEINTLLKTPHWSHLGKESRIFPDEIMDDIWQKFYSDIIVERIKTFFNLLTWKFDRYYRNYYVYLLLCWIEKNFDNIFSRLILTDNNVKTLFGMIYNEIMAIKKRNYTFEANCPQFKELFRKFMTILDTC